MDRNTLLALVLSLLILMTWSTWQASQMPLPEAEEKGSVAAESAAPEAPGPAGQPTQPTSPAPAPVAEVTPAPTPVVESAAPWSKVFRTDLYEATVSNQGGSLVSWRLMLPTYVERTPDGERPIELLSVEEGKNLVLATPFADLGFGDLGSRRYTVESVGADSVAFVLSLQGVTIRKSYRFDLEDYSLQFSVSVQNESDRTLSPRFETQWPAHVRTAKDFSEQSFAAVHDGDVEREAVAGIGVPGFFSNFFGNSDPDGISRFRGGVEWAGVDMKYFVGALLPGRAQNANARFEPIEPGRSGMTVLSFAPVSLPPGQSIQNEFRVYLGPKEPARLEAIGADLPKAIDLGYGWIAPLTSFFVWLLGLIYAVVHNYGVAIILVTILVRVVTLPIVGRQMKSMERMRAVQPRVTALQEKFKDDRPKQSEAMMKLYKEEGVNPLGGCLPMLLQFPVFIGLFFALQSSIELRHAPFFGYITDLSAPATLFVIPGLDLPVRLLPILMGLSMVVQQRMTPMTLDPAQARMMMTIMPVMMTVLFYQFPSGLVLYWMVSNLLGIAHQAWVGHKQRAAA